MTDPIPPVPMTAVVMTETSWIEAQCLGDWPAST
ncbi:MAG: hypothetical protein JWO75_5174 [Actinomycetia bacterium]|nr:hypothetical protein [Actinomycetes bacterium]